ncbi:hypothetical protein A3Q56_06169 [Intoshia linei]|uniref:Uncharacterized protein n=1 Tax=Intoshia linei TaxID=1819745 RepID=A0A177AVT3_9BILA|nr:hypothetical protein A3Q56_06169 [Intoshia linei]
MDSNFRNLVEQLPDVYLEAPVWILKRKFAFMKIDVVEEMFLYLTLSQFDDLRYHEQLNALPVRLLEINNFDKEKSIFDFRQLLWTFKIIAWSDIQLHRSADAIDLCF